MTSHRQISKLFIFTWILSSLSIIALQDEVTAQDTDVQVYVDSTYQTITGFGAANIVDWYGPDLTMDEVDLAYGTGEGQLGFNILRLRISPNPADWDNGNQIQTAIKAQEMGAIVWAAPWNPPESMAIYYDEGDGSPQRKVDPEKYGDYAKHLNDFYHYMKDNGLDLYGISVQNEPDYADTWTEWQPEEIVSFIRDYADSIDTRIIAPESFQFRRNYSDAILNDSLANAKTDIIGGHIYGGGLSRYPLAEEKGKEVWMTEHYTSSDRSANIWPDALLVGSEIEDVLGAGWHAYIWWQIKRYYSPIHDGVDATTDDFEDRAVLGSVTKRGWVMSHFSRFIRPGYQRIEVDVPFYRGAPNITASGYKDSSNVVLVIINNENSDEEMTFSFNGGSAQTLQRYVTDEDNNVEMLDDVSVADQSFTLTLGAQSITTLVSDNLTVSNETIESQPSSIYLRQNYPNPFNPVTMISYQLPVSGEVTLKVFDLLGREVATLVEGGVNAGTHQVRFDASGLSSGVYLYTLETSGFTQTRKMLLIK